MPNIRLLILLSVFISSSTLFASVKESILSDCNKAATEVVTLDPEEKKETIQFIERILSVDPGANQPVSIKLAPSTPQFALSDDLRKSLIPARDPEIVECALRLLPSLLPESSSLLPLLIRESTEASASHDLQDAFQKSALKLVQQTVQKNLSISPSVIQELVKNLKGTTSSLSQVALLEIGNSALKEIFNQWGISDESQHAILTETARMIDPACEMYPDELNRMLSSVDDKVRMRTVSFISRCTAHADENENAIINLLSDKNAEIRSAVAKLMSAKLKEIKSSGFIQIVSQVSDADWSEYFLPALEEHAGVRTSFRTAVIDRFNDLSPEIAVRVLDVMSKEDIPLLQEVLTNKKTPVFLKVAAAHRLLSFGGGVEAVTKLLSEKPALVVNSEDKLSLIVQLLAIRTVPAFRSNYFDLFKQTTTLPSDVLLGASKNILPKATVKELEGMLRSGNVTLALDILKEVKLSDSSAALFLLKEALNDQVIAHRMIWAAILKPYSKELKDELQKRLKGNFDPRVMLFSATLNLLSKQQLLSALSRSEFLCEEYKTFLEKFPASADLRASRFNVLLSCLDKNNEAYLRQLLTSLKPLQEKEEETVINKIIAHPDRESLAVLPLEFSSASEDRFLASLFEGATPIETRDLLHNLASRGYFSSSLVKEAHSVYEHASDDALRYEALQVLVKYPQDGFDAHEAVRAALRNVTNFEKGILLIQAMPQEQASMVLSQSLRDLPLERLYRLLEIIPSLGIHDPSLNGALDEIESRISDPETQYRIAAVRAVLNPSSPAVVDSVKSYLMSRYSREFRNLLLAYREKISGLLENIRTSPNSPGLSRLQAAL